MPKTYDLNKIREAIPALSQVYQGRSVVYLNGPAGTQVPRCVPEAMSNYLFETNSNLGGPFPASIKTSEIMEEARAAAAAFFNAKNPKEISFGLNMTSLVFQFSRALSNTWLPGDNIILSDLEHDSNISPWVMAAKEKGVEVRYWRAQKENLNLDTQDLALLLDKKTRLVSITMASNLLGSIIDVRLATSLAKQVGSHVFVDATHAAAHLLIDLQRIDCDFMACSAYKFSGPHLGILYGRQESMEKISPYKVPHVLNSSSSIWEQGTQNFEALAGLVAILKYKAKMVGDGAVSTENLHGAMQAIFEHERKLILKFLEGLKSPELKKFDRYGLFSAGDFSRRTPTFALRFQNQDPSETARFFAEQGLFTGSGYFHCSNLIHRLGLEKLSSEGASSQGGVWRIGFAYYTSLEEIDRLLETMLHFSHVYAQDKHLLSSLV